MSSDRFHGDVAAGRRIRVAVVEPVGRGGMAHYAFQLCRGLQRAGAAPTLITGSPYELSGLTHDFPKIDLFRLWDPKPTDGDSGPRILNSLRRACRGIRWYREWWKLYRFLRRERPEVIQLGDIRFATDLAPVMLLRRLGTPLFDICHNIEPFQHRGGRAGSFSSSALAHRLLQAAYTRMDGVFVHFSVNRARFLDSFDVSPDRVWVIPHGNQALIRELADPSYGSDRVRRELDIGVDQPIVLCFGTLAEYKGIDRLIQAMPELLSSVPDARMVIVGHPLPGFDIEARERLAASLGIQDSVRIVARYVPTPEIRAWFEAATVVALPYLQGYQSGVLHLAQSFGKPVVARAVGGLSEAISDGVDGFIVPADAAEECFTEALRELLLDPDRARAMGAAALKASERLFSWDVVGQTLLSSYERALDGPGEGIS